jgi:hypothetical protein
MEGTSNDKSEKTKTAAWLRPSKAARYDRKGRINGNENLSSRTSNSQDNPEIWDENQMTRFKWYSPQLAREIVSRLYYKAKAEGIPMTRLANRIIQQALDTEQAIQVQVDARCGSSHCRAREQSSTAS